MFELHKAFMLIVKYGKKVPSNTNVSLFPYFFCGNVCVISIFHLINELSLCDWIGVPRHVVVSQVFYKMFCVSQDGFLFFCFQTRVWFEKH